MSKKDKKMTRDEQVENVQERISAARAARLAAYKPQPEEQSEQERRQAFQVFWASNRSSYGKERDMEQLLWLHLKAIKHDTQDKFEAGIENFGLKKLK